MPGCSSGCSDSGNFDGTPKTSPVTTPDDQKKCNVTAVILPVLLSMNYLTVDAALWRF